MGRSAAPASIIDAHTNPLLPADFIVPSLTRYLLLGRCFHIGRPLYKRTQRLRVRILGSVPIQHQFALQQSATTTARAKTCRTGLRSKIVDVTARFGSSDSRLIASKLPLEQSRRGARRQPTCSIKKARDFRKWQIVLQNSQNALRSISRKLTKRAAIADRCRLQAIAEVACEFIADSVVPQMIIRSPRVQPGKLLLVDTKRLLQHYRHLTDVAVVLMNVRF
jgi:hypothetical protein